MPHSMPQDRAIYNFIVSGVSAWRAVVVTVDAWGYHGRQNKAGQYGAVARGNDSDTMPMA
jgi:hypothetical protein